MNFREIYGKFLLHYKEYQYNCEKKKSTLISLRSPDIIKWQKKIINKLKDGNKFGKKDKLYL